MGMPKNPATTYVSISVGLADSTCRRKEHSRSSMQVKSCREGRVTGWGIGLVPMALSKVCLNSVSRTSRRSEFWSTKAMALGWRAVSCLSARNLGTLPIHVDKGVALSQPEDWASESMDDRIMMD